MRRILSRVTLLAAATITLAALPAGAVDVLATGPLLGLSGRYALPAQTPTELVVFAHGHNNSSLSWVGHLQQAAQHGAVAVAPDYRGLEPAPGYGGWPAVAGAEDLVTSAQFFLNRCPTIRHVYLMGVSMGGNMSGLALASKPARADGSPLFDYWVDVEGVNDLIQEYLIARGVGPAVASGAVAQAEIEKETGGPLESKPSEYQSRTNIFRVQDIAASKVKGAVLVHGVEDGLVPSDQSDSMTAALRAAGVPTDLYSVLRRGQERDPGHDQTTLISDAGQGESDPFAGHGWEGSNTHIVINTGLQRLWALMDANTTRPSNQNFFVDYGLGVTPSSDLATSPSPVGPGRSLCATSVERGSTPAVLPLRRITTPNTSAGLAPPLGGLLFPVVGLLLLAASAVLRRRGPA